MAINNTLTFGLQNLTPTPKFGMANTTFSGVNPTPFPAPVPQPAAPKVAVSTTQNQPQSKAQTATFNPAAPLAPVTQPAPAAPSLQPAPVKPLFNTVAGSLAGLASQPNALAQNYTQQAADYGAGSIPIAAQAQDIAKQFGQKYADIGQEGAQFQAGQLTTGTTPVGEGNAAVTARTTAAQQTALAQGQQAALQGIGYELTGQQQAQQAANAAAGQSLTSQGLQQTGLQNAGGLLQPQLAGYLQKYYYPGQDNTGGGVGGVSLDPTTQTNSLAQEVASGTRTYQDAVDMANSYGPGASLLLKDAITKLNPNFNFAQATTLGATQGSVAPNLTQAQNAITNLQTTLSSAPWWQNTGVPTLNALGTLVSQTFGYGLQSATEKANAIKESRINVANALGAMTNSTPTNWVDTVNSWFPDNATPSQIQAGIDQFTNMAAYRQSIFGNPGAVQPFNQNQNASSNSNSLYSF